MTELAVQHQLNFDGIAADLTARTESGSKMMAQFQATTLEQARKAFATMTAGSTGDSAPHLSLAAASRKEANASESDTPDESGQRPSDTSSRGQSDSLDAGGYNLIIGAKVPSGAVGIVTKFGKVEDGVLDPGWNWKSPLETVEMLSTRLHSDAVRAQAASHDLQQVTTELTVPFSLNAKFAGEVFKKIGNLDQVEAIIINPGVLESVKAIAAKYTAEELITKREEVKTKVEDAIKNYVNQTLTDRGITGAVDIGNVAITHFDFSKDFNRSIELKVKAEQDALRAENEKRQKVTEAEATRDSQKATADGEAYAMDVRSKAEAAAIQRRAQALATNPEIVQLNAVERWDGHLPVYTGGGPVPFINVDKLKQSPAQHN